MDVLSLELPATETTLPSDESLIENDSISEEVRIDETEEQDHVAVLESILRSGELDKLEFNGAMLDELLPGLMTGSTAKRKHDAVDAEDSGTTHEDARYRPEYDGPDAGEIAASGALADIEKDVEDLFADEKCIEKDIIPQKDLDESSMPLQDESIAEAAVSNMLSPSPRHNFRVLHAANYPLVFALEPMLPTPSPSPSIESDTQSVELTKVLKNITELKSRILSTHSAVTTYAAIKSAYAQVCDYSASQAQLLAQERQKVAELEHRNGILAHKLRAANIKVTQLQKVTQLIPNPGVILRKIASLQDELAAKNRLIEQLQKGVNCE
ncbi:uncharacterized protein V1518DRAFT_410174 [Limtongia smithiae]|uniref:uncharacterized protein n=1 Tax=Limtongia smithiae TaxID=1125753 RepID=UPI0034CEFB7F